MGSGKAGPNAATCMDSQPLYRTLVSPARHRTAAYRDHGRMVSRTGVPMDLFARQRTRSAFVRITRFRAVQRNETETVMGKKRLRAHSLCLRCAHALDPSLAVDFRNVYGAFRSKCLLRISSLRPFPPHVVHFVGRLWGLAHTFSPGSSLAAHRFACLGNPYGTPSLAVSFNCA